MRKLQPPTPADVARFLKKVTLDQDSGCWLFESSRDEKGYGKFWWRRKSWWAHRLAYLWFRGPIPDGIETDHLCRNPSCVCPWHFDLKDKSENTADGNSNRWKPDEARPAGYGVGGRIEVISFTLDDLVEAEGDVTINLMTGEVVQTAKAGPLAGCSCRMKGKTCCFQPE